MTATGLVVTVLSTLAVGAFGCIVGEIERVRDHVHAYFARINEAEIARLTADLADPLEDLSLGALPAVGKGRVVRRVTTRAGA